MKGKMTRSDGRTYDIVISDPPSLPPPNRWEIWDKDSYVCHFWIDYHYLKVELNYNNGEQHNLKFALDKFIGFELIKNKDHELIRIYFSGMIFQIGFDFNYSGKRDPEYQNKFNQLKKHFGYN